MYEVLFQKMECVIFFYPLMFSKIADFSKSATVVFNLP